MSYFYESPGNMLFFMSSFIADVNRFSCVYFGVFFMKKNQSVCMFTLIFFFFVLLCWYLAFFNHLIIIVLCSFDSRQFPEINENKQTKQKRSCSQNMAVDAPRLAASQRPRAPRNDSDRQKQSTAAVRSFHFQSRRRAPSSPSKWRHFHPK